jgi:hypothetical protein
MSLRCWLATGISPYIAYSCSADFQSAASQCFQPAMRSKSQPWLVLETLPIGNRRLARSRPLARPCGPCRHCASAIPCAASQPSQVNRLENCATALRHRIRRDRVCHFRISLYISHCCSADFQSAVSPGFQPAARSQGQARLVFDTLPIGNRRSSRLETCATAVRHRIRRDGV